MIVQFQFKNFEKISDKYKMTLIDKKNMTKILNYVRVWDTNRSLDPDPKIRFVVNEKKRTCQLMDFMAHWPSE